jgi:hypothetical protein
MTHGVVDLDGWRSSLATCGGLCVASARGVGCMCPYRYGFRAKN